ncbi:hypothetical protein IJZ97_03570 [bacterium]|nr:hypothetical protein [bacterium]
MYFIELLVKKFKKKEVLQDSYDPMKEDESEEENCEHVFMPIDSTGEILSCRNCGLVVNRKDLKDINFFRKK